MPRTMLPAVLLAVALAALPARAAVDAPAPGEPLTLERAVALALAHSPRLAAAGHERTALAAEARQAGRAPNPELALDLENFAGSGDLAGFGGAEATLSLAQVLELGGKRARRAAAVDRAGALAEQDREVARLEVGAAAARAFVAVLAGQGRVALADEVIAAAVADSAAVHARVDAGAASPVDLARARIAAASARLDRRRAASGLAGARADLAATWGAVQADFGPAVGTLEALAAVPGLAALRARLDGGPRTARWAADLACSDADVALARAEAAIDLTAAVGYRRLGLDGDGRGALVAGVALPLPVRDRNRGAVAAAAARRERSRAESRQAAADLAARLTTAHAGLAEAVDELRVLRDTILPEAASAVDAAGHAYTQGLFSLTDVLDVRLVHADLRGRELDALARCRTAAITLESLVGGPLFDDADEGNEP